MVRAAGVAVLLWASWAMPATAQAQSDASEARALFERGMQHAADQEWIQALEAFRASADRYDRAGTHLNIASVLLRLGRHVEARDGVRRLLQRDDLSGPDRERAEALLERANDGIHAIALHVEPPTASVHLDGRLVAGEGEDRELELDPGTHRVEVRAEGYGTETRELPTSVSEVDIRLVPVPATLRVRSSVESATITLDGEVAGVGRVEIEVPAGRHELAVTAEQHERFERWLALSPGERLNVVASLSRRQGGELWEDPWFWGIGGGVLLVAAALAIGLTAGLAPGPQYDGGTLDDVLMPR